MATSRKPKKVAKTRKVVGKKAVPKRGVVKTATPLLGKRMSHDAINYRKDEDYQAFLDAVNKNKGRITASAIPKYTPIRKLVNGKLRTTGYYNANSRVKVSTHYYQKVFSPMFRDVSKREEALQKLSIANRELNKVTSGIPRGENERKLQEKLVSNIENKIDALSAKVRQENARLNAYEESIKRQRTARTIRGNDLVSSYQLVHPDMPRSQIRNDERFKELVLLLESYHASQYGINTGNVELINKIYGGTEIPFEKAEEETQALIAQFTENISTDKTYQQVLVDLGRRLPNETAPVGNYPKGVYPAPGQYIEQWVKPYYEGK